METYIKNIREFKMKIYGRYKGGRLANGFESDRGTIIHAVPEHSRKALCGTEPGKRRSVGWLPFDEWLVLDEVTCKKCLKKLEKINEMV
jgi:hypothetical protein